MNVAMSGILEGNSASRFGLRVVLGMDGAKWRWLVKVQVEIGKTRPRLCWEGWKGIRRS